MQFVRKILNGRDLADIIELPVKMKNIPLEVLILPMIESNKIANKELFDKFENILNIPDEDIDKEIKLQMLDPFSIFA